MKICHVCSAVCEENAELCAVCGADLIVGVEETNNEACEKDEIKNPVLLATIADLVSAEIFMDILKDNEILFSTNQADEGMKIVFGGGFVSVDLYVDNNDFQKADELYKEFLKTENEYNSQFDEEFTDDEE